MHLSIVPNFEGKLHATDKVKKLSLEFRKFPPVELTLALVKAYPSHRSPIIALKGPFYQRFKTTLFKKLGQMWMEDSPVIYEMVCAIQDDLIPDLIAEYPSDLI